MKTISREFLKAYNKRVDVWLSVHQRNRPRPMPFSSSFCFLSFWWASLGELVIDWSPSSRTTQQKRKSSGITVRFKDRNMELQLYKKAQSEVKNIICLSLRDRLPTGPRERGESPSSQADLQGMLSVNGSWSVMHGLASPLSPER